MAGKESVWSRYGGYAGVDVEQLSSSIENKEIEEAEISRVAAEGLKIAKERFKISGTPKHPDADDVVSVMAGLGVEASPRVRDVAQMVINSSVELVSA